MTEKYKTLNAAMVAEDDLAEAELRYKLLSETFEAVPTLRGNINSQLERAKAEILRLRAAAATSDPAGATADDPRVVPFDASRFRKSGTPPVAAASPPG